MLQNIKNSCHRPAGAHSGNIFATAATFGKPSVSYAPNKQITLKSKLMDSGLRDVLMPLVVLGTIGTSIVWFTKTLSDYILKKNMIEKGYVNEDTQAIFKKNTDENRYSSLKWGLIILFGGLALVLMDFIDYDSRSPLPYGLFAVFVSLGFLIYYFIVKKELNR